MLGAYYQAHPFDPISSLGNVSGQASLAHEAILEYLAGPIGRFAPWGEQTVNGWQEIVKPEYNYSVFPINAKTLTLAEQKAMGNPVGMVGILFRYPLPLKSVDELFAAGPYEVFRGEAIFRLDDQKQLPTAEFLYLGKLGDEGKHDGMGTYDAMERAVKAAGGVLVFVQPTGRTGAERTVAEGTLEQAVAATMGEDVPVGPAIPGVHQADLVVLLDQVNALPHDTYPPDIVTQPAAPVTSTGPSVTPEASAMYLPPTQSAAPAPSSSGSSSGGIWALAALGILGGAAAGYLLLRKKK